MLGICPLQKRGDGWRARRKKGSKTFHGPTRATEAAAMEDAQELDAAAAVSMERLQEVHDRLTGVSPGAPAASATGAVAPSRSVQKIYQGWRARRKMGIRRSMGLSARPRQLQTKMRSYWKRRQRSPERLREVHDRLTSELRASVANHYSGWRVCVSVGKDKYLWSDKRRQR